MEEKRPTEISQREKEEGDDASATVELEEGQEMKNGTNRRTQTDLAPKVHDRLDTGNVKVKLRKRFWQVWRPKDPPMPPPESLDDAPVTPLAKASILSILTYSWVTDIMVIGYQRTLQATDLWKMDESREAQTLVNHLEASWKKRIEAADEWNARLESGDIRPSVFKRARWSVRAVFPLDGVDGYAQRRALLEKQWRDVDGRKEASLAWALNDTFGWTFWSGGVFKVFGDTAQLMGPLVVKAIITFGEERYAAQTGAPMPSIGRGIGMAIGVWCLTLMASVCQHQFFWRSMTTGVLARAALTSSIYQRGVNLTGKARVTLTNAALVNHLSTDVSRIDAGAQWFHPAWTAPIQVGICLAILLVQLGPSALAGFSLFLLVAPLQERAMSFQLGIRMRSMKWTSQRADQLMEVLGAMRIVKYFTYENPLLQRIYRFRNEELKGIIKIQMAQSANIAFAFSVPALSATLAFLCYTGTAHSFNEAIIFSSLSLFNLLRQPLMLLPRAITAISDGRSALKRLTVVFKAEQRAGESINIRPEQDLALKVVNTTFEWERGASETISGDDEPSFTEKDSQGTPLASEPFQVKNINMAVPRGSLVAIVGPVGSGKSSLLQGLIGEMRKVSGDVSFGGRVAYCAQTAWIQNASLKENILFGQPYEEERYWQAIEKACLLPDLQVLPDGDLTEIGEKGINLSGGQKQRVNIARALYFDADVVIFDDPLSAVDAHVGKALFTDAILGGLRARGKTIVLVTHALHFLSQCDYIFTLSRGSIVEHGTYQQLKSAGGEFARLDEEFGGRQGEEAEQEAKEEDSVEPLELSQTDAILSAKAKASKGRRAGAGTGKLEGRLIIKEQRTTGSLSWGVYWDYFKAGRGYLTFVPIVIFAMLMQGTSVMNSYTLVWWESNALNRPNSFYQILYACLGVAQALFTLLMGFAMDVMSVFVSRNLHHHALRSIFYAPMSFFDTTPTGRILSVFGKDIDTIDNLLPLSMRMLVLGLANVVGSIVIVTILEYYFIIAAACIALLYYYLSEFYKASSLEIKRIDSLLRSLLYAHFSESLTGLPTIRSYGEISRFLRDNRYYIDLEDRALFLTATNQRWLAVRLDFCGAILTFIVAIFTVVGVTGINPAQIGLVLSYMTSLTQLTSMVTRQSAEVENYMNSVERVVYYSRGDQIEQEPPHDIPDRKPPQSWPTSGAVEFKDVKMSYRKGLPLVLKGISLNVKAGEKIGIVGRTGAGKSSLMLALFRIVELSEGTITIDGIDISTLGLRDLRSKIAIIPQDPSLFSGTIRSNLDPFSLYDDARLWDALRRSFLVEPSIASKTGGSFEIPSGNATPTARFSLESVVENEGANLSVGERSLLSLARALVKDSKVVVLDEATASVDLETDSKIQQTIQSEFSDRTLLCIAHRLRTIISYDRILVLHDGNVAEFDTPVDLFNKEDGIFRGMCEGSSITLKDIERARQ